MILLEHHAKLLLGARGLPIPRGVIVGEAAAASGAIAGLKGPWVVKAQVPIGGRGKAGAIKLVTDAAAVAPTVRDLLAMRVKGRAVHACRVEEAVDFVAEAYLSIAIDPAAGKMRVILSPRGGVDVEEASASGDGMLRTGLAEANIESLKSTIDELVRDLPEPARTALRDAGFRLAAAMLPLDITFLEINPIFLLKDGEWVAGDVKMIADTNSVERHTELAEIVTQAPDLYPDTALKLNHGFDYVTLDEGGEIGLLTTGAGLSMMIVDELARLGVRAFNFCDIRTGQLRGDPARIIQVFKWIAAAPHLKVVHVNIFAGITDLGEFATLLARAMDMVPELNRFPFVVRLIGNGFDKAQVALADLVTGGRVHLEPDFDRAIGAVVAHAKAGTVTANA